MPKIAGDKRQVWAERLRENIQYVMLKRHKTVKDVAAYMGMAEKTAQIKLKDPQKFDADELITLGIYFNVNPALFWCGEFKVNVPEIPAGL